MQTLPPPTRTRKLTLAPPSCRVRRAALLAGTASSAFIFLPVSAGLLITLFTSWWHAMRYYVWELPNIHHGGYHASTLTILHTTSGFQCGRSTPFRERSAG